MYVCELLREKKKKKEKNPGLQERKADTELALLVEKVGSMSAHAIAIRIEPSSTFSLPNSPN